MVKRTIKSAKAAAKAKPASKKPALAKKPAASVKSASRAKAAAPVKVRAAAKTARKPAKSASKPANKPTPKPKAAAKPAPAKKPVAAKAAANKTKPAAKAPAKAKSPAKAGAKSRSKVAAPRVIIAPRTPVPMASRPTAMVTPFTNPVQAVPSHKTSAPVRLSKIEHDGFKVNDHVVYPTHGVGKIVAVDEQEVAGTKLELFVIAFEQEKMTLRVPLGKAKAVGMRVLSSQDAVRAALRTLKGRARIKRTMWSRRAQEYEAKINSGDLMAIAEVVRDLHRAAGQPEQSYSERQIYESALERLLREVSAVEELDGDTALKRIEGALLKAA